MEVTRWATSSRVAAIDDSSAPRPLGPGPLAPGPLAPGPLGPSGAVIPPSYQGGLDGWHGYDRPMLTRLDLRGAGGDLRSRLPRPGASGPGPLEAVREILAGVAK